MFNQGTRARSTATLGLGSNPPLLGLVCARSSLREQKCQRSLRFLRQLRQGQHFVSAALAIKPWRAKAAIGNVVMGL